MAKRLLDAHAACVAINRFICGFDRARFAESALVRSAVERQFEIVGESLGRAARDDASLPERMPDIPRIVGLRNRLIHGYDSVDDQLIWDIIHAKLPALRHSLEEELRLAGHEIPETPD